MARSHSDALVVFARTERPGPQDDLSGALCNGKKGALEVPISVSPFPKMEQWSDCTGRVTDSIERSGELIISAHSNTSLSAQVCERGL